MSGEQSDHRPVFSFEFYPPSKDGLAAFPETIKWYTQFEPAFMDLTFGAGGESADYKNTLKTTVGTLQMIHEQAPGVPLIVHMPNNRFDRTGVDMVANAFLSEGAMLMPMGGDGPPVYPGQNYPTTEALIAGLCKIHENWTGSKPLELTVAVEPEKADAIARLGDKIAAASERGAGHAKVVRAIMQYSYDSELLRAFPEKVMKEGIDRHLDIVHGFMPIGIGNRPDILRTSPSGFMTDKFGVMVPDAITRKYLEFRDKGAQALRECAVDIAVAQLLVLKNAGMKRFHFFAANRHVLTRAVMAGVWPELFGSAARPATPGARSRAVRAAVF